MRERLQKILAKAGHGSRRSAETLITTGRVTVNGVVADELGTQADVDVDRIEVDGQPIATATEDTYLVMHKPAGFVTTASDPQGRRIVTELLPPGLPPHVVPVGRLDRDTEGLLIFTSDGEFAHRLAHPRYEIEKEYQALVAGTPSSAALETLRSGVVIENKRTAPADVQITRPPHGYEAREDHVWLQLIIHEGRKRQVRQMCAAVGLPVRTLVRTRVGGVLLGRTAKGKTRAMSSRELADLRRAVGLSES